MLSETSAKIFESSFDHTALRKDIVKQKSMFSRNLRIKEIMSNDAALFKRITGQDYVPEQQFLWIQNDLRLRRGNNTTTLKRYTF